MLNREIFTQALRAYDNKDYAKALEGYYVCLNQVASSLNPGESGLLYHNLGNCLMKMKNTEDAATAYERTLKDGTYDSLTSVRYNLGMANLAVGKNEDAIEQFNEVIKDPTYSTPYKAYNGLGKANMQLGKLADAGTAFRNSAVDEKNPNPVKALNNLGVCFMGLKRPLDALETYKTIFDFDPDVAVRNKNYSNMGQAYVALHEYPLALDSFNKAMADGSFSLSDAAQSDYQKALDPSSHMDAQREALSMLGIDDDPYQNQDSLQNFEEMRTANKEAIAGENEVGAGIPSADDTGFFTVTEEDMMGITAPSNKSRKKKGSRGLKFLLAIIILLILMIGSAAALFFLGYGFPTQQTVISELFEARKSGDDQDVLKYWVATDNPETQIEILSTMNSVVATSDIEIDYLERSVTNSEAIVTATIQNGGGKVRYLIKMTRDMVSWKINGLSFDFPSTQDLKEAQTITLSEVTATTNNAGNAGSNSNNDRSSDGTAGSSGIGND